MLLFSRHQNQKPFERDGQGQTSGFQLQWTVPKSIENEMAAGSPGIQRVYYPIEFLKRCVGEQNSLPSTEQLGRATLLAVQGWLETTETLCRQAESP